MRQQLRKKLEAFCNTVKTSRKYCSVATWSCGFTSSSVAESQNSRFKKVDMRPNRPLADVLSSLTALLENLGVRDRNFGYKRAPEAVAASGAYITEYALRELVMPELTASSDYVVIANGEQTYHVNHRLSRSPCKHYHVVRTDADTVCTCNMGVVVGVPCRHILAVMMSLGQGYVHHPQLFSDHWVKHVPHFEIVLTREDIQPQEASSSSSPQSPAAVGVTVPPPGAAEPACDVSGVVGPSTSPDEAATRRPLVVECAGRGRAGVSMTPSQYNADMSLRAQNLVQRMGHDVPKLQQLEEVFDTLERKTWPAGTQEPGRDGGRLVLQPAEARGGYPRSLRLKAPVVAPRSNGVAKRKSYVCKLCGGKGHNIRTCDAAKQRAAKRARDAAGGRRPARTDTSSDSESDGVFDRNANEDMDECGRRARGET
eukprot:GHVU01033053.1.p1 GENE.GHVU01033053.1~~GHVU01033053.1.p1  ORF type:complete len:427 (-),score=35.83 GHVU01033053.1:1120-2400(-)